MFPNGPNKTIKALFREKGTITRYTTIGDSQGMKGYALCPSSTSFGYLVYVPDSEPCVIDTRHYRVIGDNVELKETVIDPLIDEAENRTVNNRSQVDDSTEPTASANTNNDRPLIPQGRSTSGGKLSNLLNPSNASTEILPQIQKT